MAITSRPIDTYLEDTEIDINGLFHYNFNDKIGDDFAVSAINYTNESIEGIKFAASPQKEETVVRFGDTDYMFHGFILTKDVDTTTEDYALMIELNSSNFTKRMFVQFPLVISDKDKESDADDLMSLIEIVDENDNAFKPITNEKINPNKWFPTNKGYRFYTFKNENTIFVLFDDQLSITQRNKEILDDTYKKYFSDGTQDSAASGTIYENTSTSSVKQINISDAEFQDIYIECSPEGDNVIRPQKVFTIRKLFDFGNNKESFVSNVEGFDADNIPEISRQFGIFLVGMVIFVIVYLMVNPEQIPAAVSNFFQKSTNYKISYKTNFYRYTIYVLTIFIAFCSLFFLLRDKPEILDYKTRFGALEIKGFPLVWFITILFGVLFFVVFREKYSYYEEKKFKWLKEYIKNLIDDILKDYQEELFNLYEDYQYVKSDPDIVNIIVGLSTVIAVIVCILVLILIIYLIVIYSEADIWVMIYFIIIFICLFALLTYVIFLAIKDNYEDIRKIKLTDIPKKAWLASKVIGNLLSITNKTIINGLEVFIIKFISFCQSPFIIYIKYLFIYGFIYALTYLMLFFTTPRESLNLKSIAVFSLFISCLCYVHIFLKSLYDFFYIPDDNRRNIENHVNVAAVAAAATQGS